MTTPSVSDQLAAALRLELDLEVASYAQLREEFLEMTERAQRASGLTRAEIAERCKGVVGKSTVYNYAGGQGYGSFPKPKLLTKYLEACGFTDEQVVFAVARCELIRILYPNGDQIIAAPREPEPAPDLDHGDPIAVRYERAMQAATASVKVWTARAEPGRIAYKKTELLKFPYTGTQEQFIRELFAKDFPLPVDADFEPPLQMAPLSSLSVRPGDIVRTEHGHLGLLTDNHQLLYLGRRGWPAGMALGRRQFVAVWRPGAGRRRYAMASSLRRITPRGAAEQHKTIGPPRPPRNHHEPSLDGVVAMVCEIVEASTRCGVPLPVDGRAIFGAALAHGVEFDYSTVEAWSPPRKATNEHAVTAPAQHAATSTAHN